MSERHDEIRAYLVREIGNIDAAQIVFERDADTGAEYVRIELREDQLEWALRENGQQIRKAAMDLGIESEV